MVRRKLGDILYPVNGSRNGNSPSGHAATHRPTTLPPGMPVVMERFKRAMAFPADVRNQLVDPHTVGSPGYLKHTANVTRVTPVSRVESSSAAFITVQRGSHSHDRRDNRRSSRPDRIPPVRAPIPRGLRISISTFAAGFVARWPLRVPAVPVARISSRGRGGEVRRGRAAARGPYVLGMLPSNPAPYAETARPDFLPGTLSTW